MLSAYHIVDKYHSIVDVVINTVHLFKILSFTVRVENKKRLHCFVTFLSIHSLHLPSKP